MELKSVNFSFLRDREPVLFRLAAVAEAMFATDPNTTLLKARQFGELTAQQIATRVRKPEWRLEKQVDLINLLLREQFVPKTVGEVLHLIRKKGNAANHDLAGAPNDALSSLKFLHQLGAWYVRAYHGEAEFRAEPFVPPAAPRDETPELRERIAELHEALTETQRRAASEAIASQEAVEEASTWRTLAEEAEAEKAAVAARLAKLEADAAATDAAGPNQLSIASERAATALALDEQDTRDLIDSALQDAGWEADHRSLRYGQGARPEKARNRAIAEWPTDSGPVDYALFAGIECVGVIEAKREAKDVPAVLRQSERYASDIKLNTDQLVATAPYSGATGESYVASYKVPFAFATNGRPYVKQLETKSGIWFRDLRRETHSARALTDWFSPRDLVAKLEQKLDAANGFAEDGTGIVGLRPYQEDAIATVESAISSGRREMLISMATGTGKTRMAIALMYRLLKQQRFRRILFLVDRKTLAEQTIDSLGNTDLEGFLKFAETYGVADPAVRVPGDDVRLHVATVQSMVARVLGGGEDRPTPGTYDFIVVDEAHRGYALDSELREEDIAFRSTADYLSKYRRVLEYFDAVKLGLTATPALQTTEIFGHPIFRYSYRQAVIDGYLIDHLPPKRIVTALNTAGITFKGGEQIDLFNPDTGEVDTAELPDELNFEVKEFNKKVFTPGFNKVVAEAVAREIPPDRPGKTLIFAARDDHADLLVHELTKALEGEYGPQPSGIVQKITGSVDRPNDVIRRFRNDAYPKYAVTVDLLTTGVDVPKITNLVFVRRVNSRILYDQMIGRATRQAKDISKESFRIFDAVDLYANLQSITEMRPVVTNPTLSFSQLVDDLRRAPTEGDQRFIRDQIVVKMRRRITRLSNEQTEQLEIMTGEPVEALPDVIKDLPPGEAKEFFDTHPQIARVLDDKPITGPRPGVPIAPHEDELIGIEDVFKDGLTPEDYIEAFERHIKENMNAVAGVVAVTQRPRELTRKTLKELALALDQEQFSEAHLRSAYGRVRNQDIAAHIAGFIRQAALGDPLVPYETRVDNALRRIAATGDWTKDQKDWLHRIGRALKEYPVADRETFEAPTFRQQGGWARAEKAFDGRLEQVLGDINEAIWSPPKSA